MRGPSITPSPNENARTAPAFVNPAKTAEAIEMPFGRLTGVGSRNHILDAVQIHQWVEQF